MTVNDSISEGRFVKYLTSSTTSSILPGRIVEFDGNGNIILPTTTPNVDQFAGISASKARTVSTAAKRDILVQKQGIAHVVCAANSAFAHGKFVRAATAGTGEGYASTAAEATTITSTALAACIGRVVTPDATTTGTTIIVSLGV